MTKHKHKLIPWYLIITVLFLLYLFASINRSWNVEAHELYNPLLASQNLPAPTPTSKASKDLPKEYSDYQVDAWVTFYAKKFGKTPSKTNHTRQLLHCLLYREAGYGSNNGYGDNGKAHGPLQFHQPTWEGYRKIMKQRGLINEIGVREDMEKAIETTAWAINDGRALAWGPVLRKECE